MALSIIKPFVHVEDSNGNPYVGAKLYVYLPGTTTPASIFSDAGLSIALANPMTGLTGSDAAGNFPRAYIAAGTYKLRAETSAGVLIWQEDTIDTGLSAGSGALPISGGGTGATTAAAARAALDVPSNSELTALASDITDIQSTLQNIVSTPQGYLTLTSGLAVLLSSVSAATSVYYTPFKGNLIPIYDGSQFNTTAFTELTLTLNSNHIASNIYDCFVISDSGTIRLVTGPAWNTATAGSGARGTGAGTTELTLTKGGLPTNAFAMTARNGATTYSVNANQGTYIGSLYMDGTNGQISCHRAWGASRKWGVWNAYNRVPIILKAGDATASWSYASATVRESNGGTTNIITVFQGLAEELYDLSFKQFVSNASAGRSSQIGIGFNSTTAASGLSFLATDNSGILQLGLIAEFIQVPSLGINNIVCLESAPAAASVTFAGTETNMVLSAKYRG